MTRSLTAPLLRGGKKGLPQIDGRVLGRYKMAKHFTVTITDATQSVVRNAAGIAAEAALDGIYALRSSVGPDVDAGVVAAYKNLANPNATSATSRVDDLDLRPIHHRLEQRVRGHVLVCFLAAYVVWHLRAALAPLTLPTRLHQREAARSDPPTAHPPRPPRPLARPTLPVRRCAGAPVRGFRELLESTWPR